MVKDTKFRLQTCDRKAWSDDYPFVDISQDPKAATAVINVANKFFQFDFAKVRFSGYAREANLEEGDDSGGPLFFVELWNGPNRWRVIHFRNVGFEGVLYADCDRDGDIRQAIGSDVIGAMISALNESKGFARDHPRSYSAYLEYGKVKLTVDYLP